MSDDWVFRPHFDIRFERQLDLRIDLVWRCWSEVELIEQWHPPMRLTMHECEADVRPGGEFRSVLQSENGDLLPELRRRYLEVLPQQRLVFSDRLQTGVDAGEGPWFTHRVELTSDSDGTAYRAFAIHASELDREQNEELDLLGVWQAQLDRLVELARGV